MAAALGGSPAYDFYLVLDFESTCEINYTIVPQEIIEFPTLKINSKTLNIESVFHHYVSPTVNRDLSEFCTELTGITQEMLEGKPDLMTTLKLFDDWMEKEGLLNPDVSSCFVTCGDWDLKTMLPGQCKHFGLRKADYFNQWINIKKVFKAVTKKFPKGMPEMLKEFQLTLEGRHHSGIDDCRNIARILTELAKRKPNITATGCYET